ncbi:Relaxase/mobilization nuclease family protein [Rhodomicrobium vannielii ATCC 17100]|uniref:Relaxase/mobilization nuclease family protein n=1 Tax=Rhodomicrobium vannielii (strain ATCC 17100 / DSM 162 / LMG 4299 / NCIMB 10020 / ATH 3.1.1) TaxID=648757 RepID=E3I094_RHOVT|nr:relaxase/mobilization nuclease domain-containing protein [Rhodomicrobium vannielii]ADP71129.1 Relaxase/mobilization nuclease family protein [Rhodomicrobium vannielii ATCC 17100]
MIAKRVKRGVASSYTGLATYILGPKGARRKEVIERLSDYILDKAGAGGRVGGIRITNCGTDEPDWALSDIIATQKQNTRASADKTYHLVVSFADNERPGDEVLEKIEERLVSAIGLEAHQRMSAVHIDTDHLHMHIAINKIHPTKFRGRSTDPQPIEVTRAFRADLQKSGVGIAMLDGAADWQEVHRRFEARKLALRQRGAGLCIEDETGRRVRASTVDRAFGIGQFVKRFGPFQGDGQTFAPGHVNRATRRDPVYDRLWTQYHLDRIRKRRAREKELQRIRKDANDAFQPVLDKYKRLRSRSANKRPPEGRMDHLKRLREEMTRRAREIAHEMSDRQDVVSRAWPRWSFDDYLAHVAQQGDGQALALLQRRSREREALNTAFTWAPSGADARRIVYSHLKPYVLKNGSSIYYLRDGGKAIDSADRIYVPEVSLQAAYLAIDLGATRFGGQPLRIEGTAEFKAAVVKAAAVSGLQITLEDRSLEAQRQAALAERQDILDDYIARRNEHAARSPGFPPHRPFCPTDRGPFVYRGRRTLPPGDRAPARRQLYRQARHPAGSRGVRETDARGDLATARTDHRETPRLVEMTADTDEEVWFLPR